LSAAPGSSPAGPRLPSAAAVTSTRDAIGDLGEKAMARLPGMVHGVVVQMTMRRPPARAARLPTGKRMTQIVSLVWSWYSTSASASAVFSTTDHITGLEPR
jgi:hypothetical protein